MEAAAAEAEALRAAAAEAEESLNDCLTSLGQEEAKVRQAAGPRADCRPASWQRAARCSGGRGRAAPRPPAQPATRPAGRAASGLPRALGCPLSRRRWVA